MIQLKAKLGTLVRQGWSNLNIGVQQIGEKVKNTTKEIVNTVAEEYEEGDYRSLSTKNDGFTRESDIDTDHRQFEGNGNAYAPWENLNLNPQVEGEVREMIMNLSESYRHFINARPDEDEFHFDLRDWVPVAMAALRKDERLNRLRYELVPEKISEYRFWRNYFYRIMLIKKAYCTDEPTRIPDDSLATAEKHAKADLNHREVTVSSATIASSPDDERFYSSELESEKNCTEKETLEEEFEEKEEDDESMNNWGMHDGEIFEDSILASDYYDKDDTGDDFSSSFYDLKHGSN